MSPPTSSTNKKPPKSPHRGLPSLAQSKEDRSRGKYKMSTSVGITGAAVIVCGIIAYKVMSERELNTGKNELLAKQRAADATVGAEWYPLRDKLEAKIVEAGKEYPGDLVDPALSRWDFRTQPGLYLRLRVADAKDPDAIRKLAPDAKKDGFVGCLMHEASPAREADAGAFAEQPWNLGQAYLSTRVLLPSWTAEVNEAEDKPRLRVFERDYEKAVREDIPLAARILKQSQFFLLVLDEDTANAPKSDAGAVTEELLQLVPHPTRVFLIDLRADKLMMRLRRTASASFKPAGGQDISDPELQSAMQRQVNNCALARRVKAEVWPAEVWPDGVPPGVSDAGAK